MIKFSVFILSLLSVFCFLNKILQITAYNKLEAEGVKFEPANLNFTEVDFSNTEIEHINLSHIQRFSKVKVINLSNTSFNREKMKYFYKIESLFYVNVNKTKLKADDILEWAKNSNVVQFEADDIIFTKDQLKLAEDLGLSVSSIISMDYF